MRDRLRSFRDRFPLAAIGIEFFSIVLGVLLALSVDQWREERNNRQLAEAALISIRREVHNNRRILEVRYPYNATVRDSMSTFASSLPEQFDLDQAISRLGLAEGTKFTELSGAAYKTALSSGALVHIDYDILSLLNRIYEAQETLKNNDDRIQSLLLSPQNLQPDNLSYTFSLAPGLMTDVVLTEQTLLASYDQFLQVTRSYGRTPSRHTDPARADTAGPMQP